MTDETDAELANKFFARFGTQDTRKPEEHILDPKCVDLVDKIFIKFALLCREYDSLYADHSRENAEKSQWINAFMKHKIYSNSQVQQALDNTELHKFGRPPQLGQFLDWCKKKPQDFGLPDLHEAFRISVKLNDIYGSYIHSHVPSSTVINHVIKQIGASKLRAMTEKDGFKLFGHYYTVACRDYVEGKINDIKIAIPDKPEYHPIDREKSNASRLVEMEKIRRMLGVSM